MKTKQFSCDNKSRAGQGNRWPLGNWFHLRSYYTNRVWLSYTEQKLRANWTLNVGVLDDEFAPTMSNFRVAIVKFEDRAKWAKSLVRQKILLQQEVE